MKYYSSASGNKLPEWATMGGSSTEPASLGSSADDRVNWARIKFKTIIEESIFNRLEKLRNTDPLVAFIYMSCAIDYLAGFWHGRKNRTDQQDYKEVVDKYFPLNNDGSKRYDANALYEDLRCDLVHNFTVGKTYVLTHGESEKHLKKTDTRQTVLNAESFEADLRRSKENYFRAINFEPELCLAAIERYRRGMIDVIRVTLDSSDI